MNALDGPLSNLLIFGKLPALAPGGSLIEAVQGLFAAGRAIAALVLVPVNDLTVS